MNILLAFDGSQHSKMAAKMLDALHLGPDSTLCVLTVVPEHTFLGGVTIDRLSRGASARASVRKSQEERAATLAREAVDMLQAGPKLETTVSRGRPAEEIVREAHRRRTDMVALGAKGEGDPARFPLGSVAQKVVKYADCSVLLVRGEIRSIRRVLLATDGSKNSDAATRFLLNLPLPQKSEVCLVTVLQSHIAAWMHMPTLDLQVNQSLLAELQEAEARAAARIMTSTRRLFKEAGYGVTSMALKGEPAEEILAAATTINPDLIVFGAKGLSGMEAFLLGSVAQRLSRYAKHSVLIVRRRQ